MLYWFESLNPYVNLGYFVLAIITLYSSNNPVIVLLCLLIALGINLKFCKQNLSQYIRIFLLMSLLVVLINPLVSHRGMTILFYIGYTPITLEASIYGIISGTKLFILLLIGIYFNYIMNYEKLSYVLSPLGNNLGLILSLSIKFIPEYLEKLKNISDTQKTKGIYLENKNKIQGAESLAYILNAFFFVTLEQGIVTIKSIKARGYSKRRIINISELKWRKIDFMCVILFAVYSLGLISTIEVTRYEIYPKISLMSFNGSVVLVSLVYSIFLLLPIVLFYIENGYVKIRQFQQRRFMDRCKY